MNKRDETLNVEIVKTECGSTMDGYGNTCFFNSFLECLKVLGRTDKHSYKELLSKGAWSDDKLGEMVETTEFDNLETLATAFKVRIAVYVENDDNFVNPHYIHIYGLKGPVARIVKLKNSLHFNAMRFVSFDPFRIESASTGAILKLQLQILEEEEAEEARNRAIDGMVKAAAATKTAIIKTAEEAVKKMTQEIELAKARETAARIREAAARREAEIEAANRKTLELTLLIAKLENEIDGWTRVLTSLGTDKATEDHIQTLCRDFRNAMDEYQCIFGHTYKLSQSK
jgi:hypothetical protein